jgi:type I restriction enzyme M protein
MAEEIKDEIVLNDDELICVLTGEKKKANAKEQMLQSIILQMNEEYGFEMSDMKRDFTFSFEDDEGKKKRVTVDLAIFRAGAAKEPENLERICIVCDTKVKSSDSKKDLEPSTSSAPSGQQEPIKNITGKYTKIIDLFHFFGQNYSNLNYDNNGIIVNTFKKGGDNYNESMGEINGGKDYEKNNRNIYDLYIPQYA